MRGVILDTNFLMIPASLEVDIFSELERICDFQYELFIVDKTIDELSKIQESQKGKHKRAASLAMMLIEQKKIKSLKTPEGHTDDVILALAKEKSHIVATQDMEFKKKLKENNIPIIFLRQKKYLVLEM
jgi:rRNA-processing protein FCF1